MTPDSGQSARRPITRCAASLYLRPIAGIPLWRQNAPKLDLADGHLCVGSVLDLQRLLDSQTKPDCASLTPFTIEEADFDSGRVKLRFEWQPAFKNLFGNVQGGFAVAMVDVLVSVAAYAKTRAWLPTVEMKSTFLAPMKLGDCFGEAQVLKVGRQFAFLEAKLWGADGKLAVHATATLAVQSQPSAS